MNAMRLLMVFCVCAAGAAHAGPYPAKAGMSTAADDANVAANNPAAMTLLDSRQFRAGVFTFSATPRSKDRLATMDPPFPHRATV